MSKSKGCNKCFEQECKCKRPKDLCYDDGCEQIIPADCVVYEPKTATSYISCYLGMPTKSNLKEILEKLDYKLCNAFTLQIDSCIADLLGITGSQVDYKVFLNKLSNHICNYSDRFVKVSPNDTQAGYLTDKITLGECLIKRIVKDANNVEKVEISIDFDCLTSKLGSSSCIEVDCCGSGGFPPNYTPLQIATNTPTVCGSNVATLTATTTCESIFWFRDNVLIASGTEKTISANISGKYFAICKSNVGDTISISNTLTITNTGACQCVDTVWVFTGNSRCVEGVSQLERRSNCMNYQWVTGGDACPPVCIPSWTEVNPIQILCGYVLNEGLEEDSFDNCKLYQLFENQCNDDQEWHEYTGSPDPNFEGCCPDTCEPDGSYICETSAQTITFKDSCGEIVKALTFASATASCEEEEAKITSAITYASGSSSSDFTIHYSLSGATTRPYQTSNVFTNVNPGENIVTVRASISGSPVQCTVSRTVTVESCEEENPPIESRYYKIESCTTEQEFYTIFDLSEAEEGQRLQTVSSDFFTYTGESELLPEAPSNLIEITTIVIGETGCPEEEPPVYTYYKLSDCHSGTTFYTSLDLSGYSVGQRVSWDGGDYLTYTGDTLETSEILEEAIEVEIEEGITGCPTKYYIVLECGSNDQYYTTEDLSDVPTAQRVTINGTMTGTYSGSYDTFDTPPSNLATSITVLEESGCPEEPVLTRYYTLLTCDTEEDGYTELDLSGQEYGQLLNIALGRTGIYTDSYIDSSTPPTPLFTEVTLGSGTGCPEPPVFTTYYPVEVCDTEEIVYVDIDLSGATIGDRIDLGGGLFGTYSGGSISLENPPSSLVENAQTTAETGCPPVYTYYELEDCHSGIKLYTDVDLSGYSIGQRVSWESGDFLTYTGNVTETSVELEEAITVEVVEDVSGCPTRYYLVVECDTLDQYYTTEDLSGIETNRRVVINGTLTGTYTGSYDEFDTPPSNLATSVVVWAESGCPPPPEEVTYYIVLRCSDEAEGFVSLDLSDAEVGDRIDLGDGEYGTYTGDYITSETEPSPYWPGAATTLETGCPE